MVGMRESQRHPEEREKLGKLNMSLRLDMTSAICGRAGSGGRQRIKREAAAEREGEERAGKEEQQLGREARSWRELRAGRRLQG